MKQRLGVACGDGGHDDNRYYCNRFVFQTWLKLCYHICVWDGFIIGSDVGLSESIPHLEIVMAKRHILYVEDNFENRVLIRRILQAEGYQVDEASDGMTGIEMAVANKPDLILLDINLPDIDGYETAARLRQIDGMADIPILALTANVMHGDRERALEAGCNGYIQKPVDVDELPAQIEGYLVTVKGVD